MMCFTDESRSKAHELNRYRSKLCALTLPRTTDSTIFFKKKTKNEFVFFYFFKKMEFINSKLLALAAASA